MEFSFFTQMFYGHFEQRTSNWYFRFNSKNISSHAPFIIYNDDIMYYNHIEKYSY